MKKENTRNQEELVLEDALTQVIFNEKEEQDMKMTMRKKLTTRTMK